MKTHFVFVKDLLAHCKGSNHKRKKRNLPTYLLLQVGDVRTWESRPRKVAYHHYCFECHKKAAPLSDDIKNMAMEAYSDTDVKIRQDTDPWPCHYCGSPSISEGPVCRKHRLRGLIDGWL